MVLSVVSTSRRASVTIVERLDRRVAVQLDQRDPLLGRLQPSALQRLHEVVIALLDAVGRLLECLEVLKAARLRSAVEEV